MGASIKIREMRAAQKFNGSCHQIFSGASTFWIFRIFSRQDWCRGFLSKSKSPWWLATHTKVLANPLPLLLLHDSVRLLLLCMAVCVSSSYVFNVRLLSLLLRTCVVWSSMSLPYGRQGSLSFDPMYGCHAPRTVRTAAVRVDCIDWFLYTQTLLLPSPHPLSPLYTQCASLSSLSLYIYYVRLLLS